MASALFAKDTKFVPGTFLAASPILSIDQKIALAQQLYDAVLNNQLQGGLRAQAERCEAGVVRW